MKSIAGLVYGPQEHHLDHIAPLCALLDVPLIVTEKHIEKLANELYPQLVIFYREYLSISQVVTENYDIILTAMASPMFESIFFLSQTLMKKRLTSIWCPHGNSDKGGASSIMTALSSEKGVCVYGPKMIDFMKQQNALPKDCKVFVLGNYRKHFFNLHRKYYQDIADKEVFLKFAKKQTTLLYSPTWDDFENASSVHLALPHLLDGLPQNMNLIVKLHPNMLIDDDVTLKQLMWKYEKAENVLFLKDFPLIYPLCENVDLYIGDTSSIGYDFLAFNKPLLFLNVREEMQNRYLHKCGVNLLPQDFSELYSYISKSLEKSNEFSELRKNAYTYTFSKTPDFKTLKKNLLLL